jgi:uncharacterized protein (DUF697 family)
MAIDPRKFDEFQSRIEKLIDEAPVSDENKDFIIETVFGGAFEDMEDLIDEAREPRLYIFGKSGVGKTSLINALAGKEIGEVGHDESTTKGSKIYHIPFEEEYASWDIIDSRGMFESTPPDGEVSEDTVSLVKQDIEEYDPDVLIHIMKPDNVRAGKKDFEAVKKLRDEIDPFPPIIYCLNQTDNLCSPGEGWPPEEDASVSGKVKKKLDKTTEFLEESREGEVSLPEVKRPFKNNQPIYGYTYNLAGGYLGVFPTYAEEEPYWNVDTLSEFIGESLPTEARLQFLQAQRRNRKRDELMRDMSRDMTDKFAKNAALIGGAPAPVADIAVLTPMQFALIGLIGSFSCRELEWATVQDYLTAMGSTTLAGFVARKLVRSLSQVVPVAGQVFSAVVAGGTTWAIGRSAEEYFFNDNVVKPSELIEEGKEKFEESLNE